MNTIDGYFNYRWTGWKPLLVLELIFLVGISRAQEFTLGGQASAWLVTNPDRATQLGLRYIPELQAGIYEDNYFIDTDLSLNMYGTS